MIKKLSDLKMQSFFVNKNLEQNLYDLSVMDTILFMYSYHFLGSMIDDGIFVEKLVEKIKPHLTELTQKFNSEIFIEEVVVYANQDVKRVFNFITEFITDFEKPSEIFSIDSIYLGGIDIPHYSRATEENSGSIH